MSYDVFILISLFMSGIALSLIIIHYRRANKIYKILHDLKLLYVPKDLSGNPEWDYAVMGGIVFSQEDERRFAEVNKRIDALAKHLGLEFYRKCQGPPYDFELRKIVKATWSKDPSAVFKFKVKPK